MECDLAPLFSPANFLICAIWFVLPKSLRYSVWAGVVGTEQRSIELAHKFDASICPTLPYSMLRLNLLASLMLRSSLLTHFMVRFHLLNHLMIFRFTMLLLVLLDDPDQWPNM